MIKAEQIGYENEVVENVSVNYLKKSYKDGIIIWLHGSGASFTGRCSSYTTLLEYNGKTMYFSGKVDGNSPNRAMIQGAVEAASHISKSMPVYIISATQLGFVTAFKGKGVNGQALQELFTILFDRKCTVTEVVLINGGDVIKQYINSCNSQSSDNQCNGNDDRNQKQMAKTYQLTEKQKRFKEIVYKECLSQVIGILRKYEVEDEIIDEILKVSVKA